MMGKQIFSVSTVSVESTGINELRENFTPILCENTLCNTCLFLKEIYI